MTNAVGVRLTVDGGRAVVTQFDQVRDRGERMFRQLAAGAREVNPAMRGLSAGVERLSDDFESAGRRLGPLGDGLNALGPAGLAASAAMAGLGVALQRAGETAGRFEAEMIRVRIAAQSNEEQTAALSAAARRMGLDFGIGATAASQAMQELLKAGVSAQDVIDGVAEAAIGMSIATGSDVSESAQVAVTALQLFGVEAERMGDVANIVTALVNETRFSLDDVALALGQGGAAAKAAGLSLEDFASILAATATSFSSGSDQGTAFRTLMLRLAAPTNEAREELQRLGISAFDASGRLRNGAELADQFRRALAAMTPVQRIASASIIAGEDAYRSITALADAGGDAVARFRDQVIPASDAVAQAREATSGYEGAQRDLAAATQELSIAIGEAGLTAALTNVTLASTDAVRVFSSLISTFTRGTSDVAAMRREVSLLESAIANAPGVLGVFGLAGAAAEGSRRRTAAGEASAAATDAEAAPGRPPDRNVFAALPGLRRPESPPPRSGESTGAGGRADSLDRAIEALRRANETQLERRNRELAEAMQTIADGERTGKLRPSDAIEQRARTTSRMVLGSREELKPFDDQIDTLDEYSKALGRLDQSQSLVEARQARFEETFRRTSGWLRTLTDDSRSWEDRLLTLGEEVIPGLVARLIEAQGTAGAGRGGWLQRLLGGIDGGGGGGWLERLFGGGGGGGGGNFWERIASAVGASFGGGRAGGGPTRPGFRYEIAEGGRPELFMLGGQGEVTPIAELMRAFRQTQPAGAGDPAKVTITIINETGAQVETQERMGASGDREVAVRLRGEVGRGIAAGEYDRYFAARFGLRPATR